MTNATKLIPLHACDCAVPHLPKRYVVSINTKKQQNKLELAHFKDKQRQNLTECAGYENNRKMAKRKTKIKMGTTDYKKMSHGRKEEHGINWEGALGRQRQKERV